jgi:hypothetical protein
MRNLLALLGAAALTALLAGWFLGWYTVRSGPGADGVRKLNIEINPAKVGADLRHGEEAVQGWLQSAHPAGQPAKADAPAKAGAPQPVQTTVESSKL